MVETVVALLLFLNGNMIEHVHKESLAQCNESKKIAESVVNTRNVVFVCKEVKAKTIIDDNKKKIVKVLDNNIFTGSGSGFFISDESFCFFPVFLSAGSVLFFIVFVKQI